jgi:general secretion pathway protein D
VTLKLTVEVSQLGETVQVGPGQEAVTIGTRTITSVIRLQSGESSLLAGLFRHDRSEGQTETPGLSAIPLIGRLFTNRAVQDKTSDLVLTLTPHIIRFPDIGEEDLAPVWVGTESRISFFGSRSPRVQSGRSPQGPFDRSRTRDSSAQQPGKDAGDEGSLPYGVRGRSVSPRRSTPDGGGTELVPSPQLRDGDADDTERDATDLEAEAVSVVGSDHPPLVVGLEPSVLALDIGTETVLQLVIENAPGSYRIPLGLSFDPNRLAIDSFEPAPGVDVMEGAIEIDSGWLTLDLLVAPTRDGPQSVGALHVRAIGAGPVPLAISSAGAVADDGSLLPVAANDGAMFVSGDGEVR